MKRAVTILLVLLLAFLSLVGCASDKKSEEQLKEEIKAQLKAEMAQENNKSANQEGPKATPKDVKDKNELYEFVYQSISKISRDTFDQCEILYADVTGDGAVEAVVVSPNVTWLENVEIVSGDSGQYQRVSSDIPLAKYTTQASYEDGFLAVVGTTGGTGEQMADMDLYVYDGRKMLSVLVGLSIEHTVAFPTADYEEKGEIEGSLKDFTYTLTKHDNRTGNDTVVKKERYTYNAKTKSFDVKAVTGQSGSMSNQGAGGGGPLYLSQLKNGDSVGGGLTIKNIDYKKGGDFARFTLAGNVILSGELYLDEMYGEIMFNTADKNNISTILIEFPENYTHKFIPGALLSFRNPDAVAKAISKSDMTKIKNGEPKQVKISVKDIDAGFKYQADADSACEFVNIVN